MLLTEGEKKESIFKGEGADALGSVKRRFADALKR